MVAAAVTRTPPLFPSFLSSPASSSMLSRCQLQQLPLQQGHRQNGTARPGTRACGVKARISNPLTAAGSTSATRNGSPMLPNGAVRAGWMCCAVAQLASPVPGWLAAAAARRLQLAQHLASSRSRAAAARAPNRKGLPAAPPPTITQIATPPRRHRPLRFHLLYYYWVGLQGTQVLPAHTHTPFPLNC